MRTQAVIVPRTYDQPEQSELIIRAHRRAMLSGIMKRETIETFLDVERMFDSMRNS